MSETKITTSIITPVWNNVSLTAQYLFTHWKFYAGRPDVEWIIIDNGSKDETPQALEYWDSIIGSRLTVIRNPKNEGYSIANNQGAEKARGRILAFLNNDVIVEGDYLGPMEQALDFTPHILVGAQLVEADTGWNKFGDILIPYLVGWCFAMPRRAFDDLGGFDERYTPADYEDSDLCYAATQGGYRLVGLDLPIRHLESQTGKLLPNRRKVTEANRLKFAEKWGLNAAR